MNGKLYASILDKIEKEGALHASLIDPDEFKQSIENAGRMAALADQAGTDLFLIGGSTAFDQIYINKTILEIKKNSNKPVIIFPGSISAVSKEADAILFMSILNSTNPNFITGSQAIGALAVKRANIEPISTAYLVLQPGCTAAWISDVKPLPRDKPELTLAYSLAAQYLGFKFIYLEAGSGSNLSVPKEIITFIKNNGVQIPIIIGGGINTSKDAKEKISAGASIIVQGTFLEKNLIKDGGKSLKTIIEAIKKAGKEKIES